MYKSTHTLILVIIFLNYIQHIKGKKKSQVYFQNIFNIFIYISSFVKLNIFQHICFAWAIVKFKSFREGKIKK